MKVMFHSFSILHEISVWIEVHSSIIIIKIIITFKFIVSQQIHSLVSCTVKVSLTQQSPCCYFFICAYCASIIAYITLHLIFNLLAILSPPLEYEQRPCVQSM